MYTKKEREYYNQHRANVCEKLGITKNQYNWFRRAGEQLHNLYEIDCNGGFTESEFETNTNIVYEKTDSKAKELELNIYYQTDPRGATIYLDKSPITQMNYTNTSCIY